MGFVSKRCCVAAVVGSEEIELSEHKNHSQ